MPNPIAKDGIGPLRNKLGALLAVRSPGNNSCYVMTVIADNIEARGTFEDKLLAANKLGDWIEVSGISKRTQLASPHTGAGTTNTIGDTYIVDPLNFTTKALRSYDGPPTYSGQIMPSLNTVKQALSDAAKRQGPHAGKNIYVYPSTLGGCIACDDPGTRNAPMTRRFWIHGDSKQEVGLTLWGRDNHTMVSRDAIGMEPGTPLAIIGPAVCNDTRNPGMLSVSINPGTGCVLPLLNTSAIAKLITRNTGNHSTANTLSGTYTGTMQLAITSDTIFVKHPSSATELKVPVTITSAARTTPITAVITTTHIVRTVFGEATATAVELALSTNTTEAEDDATIEFMTFDTPIAGTFTINNSTVQEATLDTTS